MVACMPPTVCGFGMSQLGAITAGAEKSFL